MGSKSKLTCTWARMANTGTWGFGGEREIVAIGMLRRHDSGKQDIMQHHRLSEA